jgi:hypothetical protein
MFAHNELTFGLMAVEIYSDNSLNIQKTKSCDASPNELMLAATVLLLLIILFMFL